MLPVSARRAEKTLKKLLKESPEELFFQMIWATDQLQRPVGTDVSAYLRHPPEARVTSITDPRKIHPWELEDLVNAKIRIPFTPQKKKGMVRALACDQIGIMAL